ncbi:hypothetical protein ThrDRAFT_02505 [Frankia casuarinae]|jgi:hypothetical protein|uniref:Uncharacterized protein n=1 Tax=Frankia casuarinae (strain DSM 45818 / CECT 9043 / HFP020203 / CcI3) TaxID=106370 RepID=Q2J9E4_FRACC|nr:MULTISPECIES: hypothetical protein [Frankia]ABD12098.1 hypothetical protein Francci3_2738 [Frankia casuarinae]ETA00610.1 hypothetical protein CcI6DRAFT_04000 [Frankia sp. CcI6]EYT91860.1 hypothetical protein ThrDRAFT_02505 [Frankia casuarinae]KDA41320.1 hypothetical protein BMG523Draft_03863 [Frankia sp. BMG5.23]KFB03120.1 hypothetical protein ALLO2DRAFT_04159 [Frankia sp. Allo2]
MTRSQWVVFVMNLFGLLATPLLLGWIVGGPLLIWVVLALALTGVTVVQAWPVRGILDAEKAPPSPVVVPTMAMTPVPVLSDEYQRELERRRDLAQVFSAADSAAVWHLARGDADIEATGRAMPVLDYLVSVISPKAESRLPRPRKWEHTVDDDMTFEKHAEAIIQAVLPDPADGRRGDLAAQLGIVLDRWNTSGEFGKLLKQLYPASQAIL